LKFLHIAVFLPYFFVVDGSGDIGIGLVLDKFDIAHVVFIQICQLLPLSFLVSLAFLVRIVVLLSKIHAVDKLVNVI
jgi:hypothetical protein